MKWTKAQLLSQSNVYFDEDIDFDKQSLENNKLLLDVRNLHVDGEGHYDDVEDKFEVDMHIKGILVCPCAITNEPVDVDLDSEYELEFVFEETNDLNVHVVKNGIIELIPIVFQLISLDVPLRVIKDGLIEYPKGDGWRILSEEEYQKTKDDRIDPRLAKLKEFKVDD